MNAYWLFVSDTRGDLLVGYYLWLGAFVALATSAYTAERNSLNQRSPLGESA